jgi:hypothetical protein
MRPRFPHLQRPGDYAGKRDGTADVDKEARPFMSWRLGKVAEKLRPCEYTGWLNTY